jgi:hypothetical protein
MVRFSLLCTELLLHSLTRENKKAFPAGRLSFLRGKFCFTDQTQKAAPPGGSSGYDASWP